MTSSRTLCHKCARPLPRCLCPYVQPTDNRCHLLILQHPKEHGHPKNTGELLARSLSNATLLQGETFSPKLLRPWLESAALLYPHNPGPAPDSHLPEPPSCLIVIDATWRKSRKMLCLNPQLQALPRISLSDNFARHYTIRSARHAHQLSTLEASCYALQQLEGKDQRYRPLLNQFAQYMNHLASFDPNRSAATIQRPI